ncbi:MAG: transglycosylase domain-containing protein [Rubricoccaceae bacterium]
MADPTYSDDELADFFGSPGARRAGRSDDAATTAPPVSREDAELEAFFHSPDSVSGDGASGTAPVAPTEKAGGDGAWTPPPSGPAAPPKHTGPKAIRRRKTRRALAIVIGMVGLGVLAGIGLVVYFSQGLPSLEEIENPQNKLATTVYTADGVEMARYYDGENRTWIPLSEMSIHIPNALISTEDRRFYSHWGMDLRGLAAALRDAAQGGQIRGASTITQQLARNLYRQKVTNERSLTRKIKELLTAIRIERTYTKDEILEAYLNTVPFLYNAYGIEAASQTYFSTSAADLAPEEAATLVGMLAANTRFDPVRNPENSLERRNLVLSRMNREGVLPDAEYQTARETPIQLQFDVYSHEDNLAPHLAEVLRLWFRDWCEQNGYDPYRDGLVIRTTIDSRMQALATEALQEQMDFLDRTVGNGWARGTGVPYGYWWNRNKAIVDEYVQASTDFAVLRENGTSAEQALLELRQDDTFMDSLRTVRMRLEAGLVAVDPTTGQVKAWVGGRDFVADKYDHVGQARRQPGSTFKLFAYTTAFDNGYSPRSTALNQPFAWGNWRPRNSGGGSGGWIPLQSALTSSVNIVAARMTKHFGQAEIARKAYQMGIRSPLELPEFDADECKPYAAERSGCYARSIALGTSDVNLLEMATAYATVANYGSYHGPSVEEPKLGGDGVPHHIVNAVARIENANGDIIADFTLTEREVLSPSTAYTMFTAMRGPLGGGGTGTWLRAKFPATRGLDLAGKTGTTQESADGWFMAMSPQLVVGSWTGFNDRRITFHNMYWGQGGHTALLNVGAFLQKLQTEGDSLIRLDPKVKMERPEDYAPPSRRGQIGGGRYIPGLDGRSGRARNRERSEDANASSSDRPAREILDRINNSQPAPPPQPAPQSGSGGRIGW